MFGQSVRMTLAMCAAVVSAVVGAAVVRAESVPSDESLWAGAEQRIEQYRKADALVMVVDADGQAVGGAQVLVEQTRHAFLFGSNIFAWGRVGDEGAELEYRRQFADVFNFATLPFYWASYERQRGQPAHERTAQITQWCRQQGITCKGHPLAWNHSEPRWLPDDRQEILQLQLNRIDDCVDRFRNSIAIWDVVNEATHFDRAEFLRRSPKFTDMWSDVGQIEFTLRCFQAARKTNPEATLLINDYRTDPAYVRLIEQLVDEGGSRLYDVIGIQSHQHGGTWTNGSIWEICERFASFGVPLHFTETTVVSGQRANGQPWLSTEEGEADQAREVERFYTMLYSHPAVEALTWWDFSDRAAWQGAPAGFLRKDMSPKPAYDVLHELVKQRWWTRTTAETDSQGAARFRGTLGDYKIVVKIANRTVAEGAMKLVRKGPNELVVRLDQ